MSRKILIAVSIVIIIVGIWGFRLNRTQNDLAGPLSDNPTPPPSESPSPSPLQAPKTFKFDSSTDLKQELEKVNPQVLDSDFE